MVEKYVLKNPKINVVEAVQFLGDSENPKECMIFCPPIMQETYRCNESLYFKQYGDLYRVDKTDWIVKSGDEFSVMSDADFQAEYVQKGY